MVGRRYFPFGFGLEMDYFIKTHLVVGEAPEN